MGLYYFVLSLYPCYNTPSDSFPLDSLVKKERSLDEIRFAGWTNEDYCFNDYLYAFRRNMDSLVKKIDKTNPYRELIMNSKFFVLSVRHFNFGGLLYDLAPIDAPFLLHEVWIYSFVDDDGNINEYQVLYCDTINLTKYAREGAEEMFRQVVLDTEGVLLW